ncbi:hypothetical protein ACQY0O_006778 [Thecaphora frezii]
MQMSHRPTLTSRASQDENWRIPRRSAAHKLPWHCTSDRPKHQLPARPAFVPMHGKRLREEATEDRSSSRPSRSAAGGREAEVGLTWQQRELLHMGRNDRKPSSPNDGRQPVSEAGLTWQQQQQLVGQVRQGQGRSRSRSQGHNQGSTDLLKPIRIPSSLQNLERVRGACLSQPLPLWFDMTCKGPQMSLHLLGGESAPSGGLRPDLGAPAPKAAPTVVVDDVSSDLPAWYDSTKEGPLCAVPGRRQLGNAPRADAPRPDASAAGDFAPAWPQLSPERDGEWLRAFPTSPTPSSSPSTPELDSSSSAALSCSYSPRLRCLTTITSTAVATSTIRTLTPTLAPPIVSFTPNLEPNANADLDSHHLPPLGFDLGYGYSGYSYGYGFTSPFASSSSPNSLGLFTAAAPKPANGWTDDEEVYAAPNFCNAPLPKSLPVPAFARRTGDRL